MGGFLNEGGGVRGSVADQGQAPGARAGRLAPWSVMSETWLRAPRRGEDLGRSTEPHAPGSEARRAAGPAEASNERAAGRPPNPRHPASPGAHLPQGHLLSGPAALRPVSARGKESQAAPDGPVPQRPLQFGGCGAGAAGTRLQ